MLVGVVGKPSSGKSTFLNALTNSSIAKIGNYPFTTIDPNVGVGFSYKKCICRELLASAPYCDRCISADFQRPIPIKVIDVAGLVPGAHEGKGLGNKFLSDLSQADILLHIVDSSGSLNEVGEDVEPGSHDPGKDVEFLEKEIDQWIAGIMKSGWDKAKRTARSAKTPLDEILVERLTGIKINRSHIKKVLADQSLNFSSLIENWDITTLERFASEIRKISKPMILVANKIDRPGADQKYQQLKQKFPDLTVVATSALAEIALQAFHTAGKIEYDALKDSLISQELNEKEKTTINKIKSEILDKYQSTGISKVLNLAVDTLDYIVAFPVADTAKLTDQQNQILPDAHLIKLGTNVKDFAGLIHKDLQENFVCGIDARNNKRLGETHLVKDRDVIKIMSSK